jgi:GntR family transcriptional regulator
MTVAEFLQPDRWLLPDGGPRYVQLRQRLTKGVREGVLPPGSSLPPERELAAITELSRVTVRKAIQSLAEDGLIVQRQGSGSFVSDRSAPIRQSLTRLTSFSEDMARRGLTATSLWLERGLFLATPEEVQALGLEPDSSVARVARLRLADDQPMAIERASLPLHILPNPLAVETSLYAVLEQAGLRPVRAVQSISAINLGADDAGLLKVAPGAAGLRIARTSYLADGGTVEFTQSIYRGDAYSFVAELRLTKE